MIVDAIRRRPIAAAIVGYVLGSIVLSYVRDIEAARKSTAELVAKLEMQAGYIDKIRERAIEKEFSDG